MNPIYLDHCATTPLEPRVFEFMRPCFFESFGNPSAENMQGIKARETVLDCRKRICAAMGIADGRVVFTSGATEANNLVILGLGRFYKELGNHIVTTAIEHPSLLEPCYNLQEQGFEISFLKPGADGRIRPEDVANAIGSKTTIVSVQAVNNITGIIQPITEIGEICRRRGVLFHTDATQAIGKMPFFPGQLPVDMVSVSAHKFYGPTGIGALLVNENNHAEFALTPLLYGGGQQSGIRPGSMNLAGIVGLTTAMEIAIDEQEEQEERAGHLDELLTQSLNLIDDIHWCGDARHRVKGHLCFCIPGIDTDLLQKALLSQISFATSSACGAGKGEPSHVLMAMGFSAELAGSLVRISTGRFNTDMEIKRAASILVCVIQESRCKSLL